MRGAEQGLLLLTSMLGNPERRPLSAAQMRTLAQQAQGLTAAEPNRELQEADLIRIGYGREMAQRILALLSEEDLLERYIRIGRRAGCVPLTRVTEGYPAVLRQRLGMESPCCLWAKGNPAILDMPMVSLVGSRDISPENRKFAWEAGVQAARQGYVLVSGNARGADRIAQTACLQSGGCVVSVVADTLSEKQAREKVLYLSEDGFDLPFTAQRALSRNRVIHALGKITLVAQCDSGTGGTWSGTEKNLRHGWSPVFCFDDGSAAADRLEQLGAGLIDPEKLSDLGALRNSAQNLFDQ